jgi:hypothetical protein
MHIENINSELPVLVQPANIDSPGSALLSLVGAFAIEVVLVNGTHYASYNNSDNLVDQLQEIADTATASLSELEDGLVERYWPEDDREDPRIVGY